MSVGATVSRCDTTAFTWHNNDKTGGVMWTHNDDFLFWGFQKFIKNIINLLGQAFIIGKPYSKTFKYLGVNLNQA